MRLLEAWIVVPLTICRHKMGAVEMTPHPPPWSVIPSASSAHQVGTSARVITDALRAEMERKWQEVVEAATGFKDYDSLRRQVSRLPRRETA